MRDQPPGEDGLRDIAASTPIPSNARRDGEKEDKPIGQKMLRLVGIAESSADRYANHVRKSWSRSYKAFRNDHYDGSKYTNKDYRHRSSLFRPKTRAAVRKAMAATASSLFSTVDAVAIQPGNEADDKCRAAASLMQEVVNYRLDRTSGRNAIPWFKTAMGATQDATLTGIVCSKQYWKLQTKQTGEEPHIDVDPETGEETELWEQDEETGETTQVMKPILKTIFDRPDSVLISPENVILDSGADWTDPAQTAAFLFIKWPMKIDDIREREKDLRDPWKRLDDSALRGGKGDRASANPQAIRSSRDGGTDRFDAANNADEFSTVWVYECFVRAEGEDYTFFSIGSQHLLTEPRPVDEVYPWNDGERPVIIGYGSLESHKIFPMAPAESWQPLQNEINDLVNLTLDTVKMNVAPVAKVKRGAQVDLDALRRRGPGSNLLMTSLDSVAFEKPPGVDAGAWQQMDRLNVDFDTLAGQFDSGSVQTNRTMNETVGGMRLISGAANALQEFDQRVFFETWAEPVLGQIVRLCQYYEHDETILSLCGERAQLWEKFGVSEINDEILDKQITIRIDIGIGAGDPQQRLAKFQSATAVVAPLLQSSKQFQSGEWELDIEAVMQEVYGGAGYRDGGQRFIKKNPPQQGPNPQQQLEAEKIKATIEKDRSAAALNMAKAQIEPMDAQLRVAELISDIMGKKADQHSQHMDRIERHVDREDQRQNRTEDVGLQREQMAQSAAESEGGAPAPSQPQPQGQPQQPDSGVNAQAMQIAARAAQLAQLVSQPREQHIEMIRDHGGQITGARITMGNGQVRVVHFHRKGGRIMDASVIDQQQGAGPPPIALPPPGLSTMAQPGQ